MASIVAGPIPPWETIVIGIVEAGATSRSPFSSFLVPVIAEANDQTDLQHENDHDNYNDCGVVSG
jgi:hypothetical protein